MKKYFNTIREQLKRELAQSASRYLWIGLDLFHKARNKGHYGIQPPIGNLGIAIELMLKTLIVEKNPLLIFQNLPLELKVLFTCPDALPKSFNWKIYDIDIRSFAFKTVELNDCISTFYIFFPEHKQFLQPYFRFFSGCRNASIHASLPSFQKYDLEKTAYLALHVVEILKESKAFSYFLTKEDKDFLSTFKEERAERVRKKIEAAKEKSKKITKVGLMYAGGWEQFMTSCPICDSMGVLKGYTDVYGDVDEDGIVYPYLEFYADSFECDKCGLVLDDVEELRLAGMDTEYDRNDELEKWTKEQGLEDIELP